MSWLMSCWRAGNLHDNQTFCGLGAIFMLVALVQLTRSALGWSLSINGYDIWSGRVGSLS
jgi:hypothetical protein